ncbi:related to vacuolar endopolyphosphatase [Lecanosticta acicola]|uniref:Endopolyphosphatase n=1 Tax=Lecanosticta acicola TaxID=111012 RepID=A0AAI9EE74_9PEZI|nr:related to vacuolar endopolyphosphatase [Lecanosticta acicola]
MHGMIKYLTAALLTRALAAPPAQVPLKGEGETDDRIGLAETTEKRRPLHGRFLQITDFHPDRFYEVYSSTSEESACHRGKGPAGIYGAETSECDSPIALVNKTMEWVAKEFKDKIDFVVWTGDSARHDNDEDLPRTQEQVLGLNRFMVQKMAEAFGKHNGDEEDEDPNNDFIIPIVPNFGNNDILPHNILAKGPNKWTRTYASIWTQFIPEVQKHSFEQGGWFYVEVIPNKLAVFSLNTLYFFDSNAAADGCAIHSEPGYQQMEWLRIQLQFMRDRGMKAILIGHVPPARQETKTLWDETCWQKYTLWNRQYRDVIVTSLWGHFNYDHFMLQDFKDLHKGTKKGRMNYYNALDSDDDSGGELSTQDKTEYFIQLRDEWSELPKPPNKPKSTSWFDLAIGKKKDDRKYKKKLRKYLKKVGGKHAERFAASFVSGSVVPNLMPTMRVFEYNTTGLGSHNNDIDSIPPPAHFEFDTSRIDATRKKHKKYKFTVPDAPSKSSPPGPAYSPQTLSLVKYTQYFANLTYINNDFTHSSEKAEDDIDAAKWNEGKHKGKKPHDKDYKPKPRKFKYEVLYDTKEDDVYRLEDLTMPSLLDLARRVGSFVPPEDESEDIDLDTVFADDVDEEKKGKKNKKKKKKHRKGGKKKKKDPNRKENEAWYTFIRRAYVETMSPEDVEEEFGH